MQQQLAQLGNGAHALATQLLGSSEAASDAVHDAFATALSRPEAFDPGKGSLNVWFLRVVRNRCIDLLRMRKPNDNEVETLVSSADDPQQNAEKYEQIQHLRSALASLPHAQREIILLRDYLDLNYADVSRVLDIPAGTVMSRLHRARLALKKELIPNEH